LAQGVGAGCAIRHRNWIDQIHRQRQLAGLAAITSRFLDGKQHHPVRHVIDNHRNRAIHF